MAATSEYVRGTMVPKSFVEPLGYLAVWFALLEQNVNAALAFFFDLELERGNLLSAQFNSIRVKMDIIELLAEKQIINAAWKKAFADVMSNAQKANTERNDILHGDWLYTMESLTETDAPIFKSSTTRQGKGKNVKLTAKKIIDVANDSLNAAVGLEMALRSVKRIIPDGWPPRTR